MPNGEEHMDVQRFTILIPQPALADLLLRLAMPRLPDEVPGTGWGLGTNLAYLRDLVHYWRASFDWRAPERVLNAIPQFRADVGGMRVPFIHVRGVGAHPVPLILTPGWPSSFVEILKSVPPLPH